MQNKAWEQRRVQWLKRNKIATTKGTPANLKKLAYMRKWKAKKYREDESYRNKRCAENRAAYARRVQDPEYREKLRAYQREYRKNRKLGKKATGSS